MYTESKTRLETVRMGLMSFPITFGTVKINIAKTAINPKPIELFFFPLFLVCSNVPVSKQKL